MNITQRFLFGAIATCFVLVASMASVSAATVTVGIAWSGANGYSLGGEFSFDDSAGPVIDETELITFEIEGFENGSSIGAYSIPPNTVNDFNFTVATLLFGPNQDWNVGGSGIGFFSSITGQCLTEDSEIMCIADSQIPGFTLVATPLPAALPLFLSVLVGMGLLRWRRRKAVSMGGLLVGR